MFPDELFQPPRHWVKHAYHNLVYFNEAAKGGHRAAWEEPQPLPKRCEPRSGLTAPVSSLSPAGRLARLCTRNYPRANRAALITA